MLSSSNFTSQECPPYGKRIGGTRALDPIDARDGFSKANPETFGPRALDAKKAQLAANKAAAATAAKSPAASSSSSAPVIIDPSSLSLTDPARAKSALPYVALAVLVTFVAVRFLAR